MKRNENYLLKEIAGNAVLIPLGEGTINFNGVISLNSTGKTIWEHLENDVDFETLANVLVEKFGIEYDLALNDVKAFIESLKEDGCIDE